MTLKLKELQEITWLVVVDEAQMRQNQLDLSDLNVSFENFHILVAISPLIIGAKKLTKSKFPVNENTLVIKLLSRHRNSEEISIFLLHLKSFVEKSAFYKLMDDSDDMPLKKTSFPVGKKPLFIEVSDKVSDESTLEIIKERYIESMEKDVTILYHNESLTTHRQKLIQDWCQMNLWNFVPFVNMTGSEADVVIIYNMSSYFVEGFFRAKSNLIIVNG